MKQATMITRHGVSKNEITAYTIITSDYQTKTMSVAEIQNAIKSGVEFTNLASNQKGIVSTNGAIDKYTFINSNTHMVEGTPRAVILNRVEKSDKLVGYTVFTQFGSIAELNVQDAVALANKGLISNGKIRNTENGPIVSSIGGNYPLRTIEVSKAPKGIVNVSLMYFATVVGVPVTYFGAMVSGNSAAEMSKLLDILSKSNAKVISAVVKTAGQSVRESLAIQRKDATSFYGVFETSMLDKLVKSGAKINNKFGDITISALKYEDDGVDEATVKINKEWKITESNTSDSKAATKVKEYTKKIIETCKGIKVE